MNETEQLSTYQKLKVHYLMNEAQFQSVTIITDKDCDDVYLCLSSSCHVSELLSFWWYQICFDSGPEPESDWWRKAGNLNFCGKMKTSCPDRENQFFWPCDDCTVVMDGVQFFMESKTSYLHIRRYNQESKRGRMLSSKSTLWVCYKFEGNWPWLQSSC